MVLKYTNRASTIDAGKTSDTNTYKQRILDMEGKCGENGLYKYI